MKLELKGMATIKLEGKFYNVQIEELELDAERLYIRGTVFDVSQQKDFRFADYIDLQNLSWNEIDDGTDDH